MASLSVQGSIHSGFLFLPVYQRSTVVPGFIMSVSGQAP